MNTVTYRDEVLSEFRNNLLIEAMPEPREPEQAANDLMIFPEYHDSDRKRSTAQRRILTQNIARIHHPLLREVEVEGAIDRCIRWGYADRNPLSSEYAAQLSAGYTAAVNNLGLQHAGGYHPHTYGFSILGISGIGKSTTVEAILSYYTQVIRHTLYKGINLSLTQITYMKLDCPADGSLKGLCLAFFKLLDKLVGTDYHEQYQKRTTLDFMMLKMAQLTMTYNVGLIVIDELQNLCTASKDVPAKVLNFLVTLVNTIGVPVVMIGTSKALSILQSEFQQAKRGSGQGDFLWERMKNDGEWDTFCKAIWPFQYTRNEVPYSDEMRNALYSEALGIPFLAVHIYKLVQEDAILYGKETFASKDFKRIANKKMGLTKPMRDAIRVGKEVDLRQFVDIAPFTLEDYRENYSVAAEAKAPSRKLSEKPDPRKAATLTLMGLGLSQPEADNFVCRAIANLKECTLDTQIAQEAYQLYMKHEVQEPTTAPLTGMSGYNDLLVAGMIDSSHHMEAQHGHV